ncbi:DMT family transporter [Philodulcilactobacillus myokoensis]|nr:DMT family transporter [Philodulcilactobacillus myokoensis]
MTSQSSNDVMKGIMWAILASASFGVSGTVLQFASQNEAIPASWFLSARTLTCGIILLVLGFCMYGKHIFDVFKDKTSIMWLFAYGVFGLGANLLTFYKSIQSGNSAASTILQYLAPIFIVIGGVIFKHHKPVASDLLVFGIALLGVFLSITKGNIYQLDIPVNSLIWGIFSGITAALYVTLPRPLLKHHHPIIILGWGTFICGILFNLNHPIFSNAPTLKSGVILSVLATVILGTIFPFLSILHASKFASSEVVSLVDATQPVVTFILSIIFFHIQINFVEILGTVLVILAIYLLQFFHHRMALGSN